MFFTGMNLAAGTDYTMSCGKNSSSVEKLNVVSGSSRNIKGMTVELAIIKKLPMMQTKQIVKLLEWEFREYIN